MKLVKLDEVFKICYGVNLELNKMSLEEKGIPFVSRSDKNNGVVAYVGQIDNVKPNPKNTLSVAGGGSVLATFLQEEPYYSGRDLYFLQPINLLGKQYLLFYCMCLRLNKYRYSYGRQANKTLKDILIPSPEDIPNWVNYYHPLALPSKKSIQNKKIDATCREWEYFTLHELFSVASSSDDVLVNYEEGNTPYIASTAYDNGVISSVNSIAKNPAGSITVNRGGSVGECFYQPKNYIATPVDIRILKRKDKESINPYVGMFICTVLRKEQYRFNYSRKMGTSRLKKLKIKLPVNENNQPDWKFMEDYIKSLPYSKNLESFEIKENSELPNSFKQLLGKAVQPFEQDSEK